MMNELMLGPLPLTYNTTHPEVHAHGASIRHQAWLETLEPFFTQ
jgi:hypothetical protein